MRNKKNKGFTLIELLIVIAIIGILAAVLIPNLMNARTTASNRAAESYGRNVYTAGMAYLAEDIDRTSASLPGGCTDGFDVSGYAVSDPGAAVQSCSVTENGATDFTVSVTSSGGVSYSFP